MLRKSTVLALASLMLAGLMLAPVSAATSSATEDSPPCYTWYWEIDLGPVEVVSTSSCSYSVQESDDGEGPLS